MNVAIIAGAGHGTRMSRGRAKQFLELAGTPIIIHTLKRFERCADIHEIVVVVSASEIDTLSKLVEEHDLTKITNIVPGGASRAESVWRGLKVVSAATTEIVAVHDAVRPLVSSEEISRTVNAAIESGAAILGAPVTDTIKETLNGKVVRTLSRASLVRALTPQCFRYSLLIRAYEKHKGHDANTTDCSMLVEDLGETVRIVEGDGRNLKITRPEDLALAEILLREMRTDA